MWLMVLIKALTHLLYELLYTLDNMLVELKVKQREKNILNDLSNNIAEHSNKRGTALRVKKNIKETGCRLLSKSSYFPVPQIYKLMTCTKKKINK